ncbi:hypothetical protein KB879_27335 [Cupriavidus sp. KK10]|jgi:hypothetical protein|uniref:hypothetical protein n=1 Tax=Cupriavidus sp. KK10 TaxID=1478019 RepID=UPI001BAB1136|nr:hypothetical protein [Cupriavidus sp. KK10]QUN27728.1 hypothetical protein KB879_27335 [Cupriavidus sp. KK10]
MRQSSTTPNAAPDDANIGMRAALTADSTDTPSGDMATSHPVSRVTPADDAETAGSVSARHTAGKRGRQSVDRGLAATIPTNYLRQAIHLRALSIANRFRIIRTIDVALHCFPERPFKAALTAAQNAMRKLKKEKLLLHYRTDRFQHVYGLTVAGARWLDDHGVDAAASVRRCADMTNPEHALWMHFITIACEVRGLAAHTESEALQNLNKGRKDGEPVKQGFLDVSGKKRSLLLRPDVLAYEPDGVTWFEIDRSKRGDDREASLVALVQRIGGKIATGHVLRRVVVHAKTERILKRALALVRAQVVASNSQPLTTGSRAFHEIDGGIFEVRALLERRHPDGRTSLVEQCVGHVIIQLLPTWLPKVRLDAKNKHPLTGWLGENYLPYRRPSAFGPWQPVTSPLPDVVRNLTS